MRYGSICSGVAPQTKSWAAMGAHCAWFAEIEKFPASVLKHHFPEIPNLGDFTKIGADNGAIDLLVGGTPCQSFSVAGKRAGLDDPRGDLTLEFVRLLARRRPRRFLWENVPGILSIDDGRTFAEFLGFLTGRKLTVPREGWRNSGIIPGYRNAYGVAYRILDGQYFGVAQRRRRVFVVGHLGDWRAAAAVLFERESLSGNPAPSREKGKRVTASTLRSTDGGVDTDHAAAGHVIPVEGVPRDGRMDLSEVRGGELGQGGGDSGGNDMRMVRGAFAIHKNQRAEVTLNDTVGALNSGGGKPGQGYPCVAHSLRGEGFDASEDGTGRGIPLVAFDKQRIDQYGELSSTVAARDYKGPTDLVVAFSAKDHGADAPILMRNREGCDGGGKGPLLSEDVSLTLAANANDQTLFQPLEAVSSSNQAVATAFYNEATLKISEDVCHTLRSRATAGGVPDGVMTPAMAVRRLTPRECERLQGAEDDWTKVSDKTADGPRYKAIGNSWAVPVLDWIMARILKVDQLGEVKE